MPQQRAATVVLLGMMGSGKTTVGRALAARTGWRYLDNDELVRLVSGRAPAGDRRGRRRGRAARAEAAGAPPRPDRPTAAHRRGRRAGSSPILPRWPLLRAAPAVVYLRTRPETLRARIGQGLGRRDDATDLAWLQARHAERDAVYRELATLTIDTDELEADAVAGLIVEALEA